MPIEPSDEETKYFKALEIEQRRDLRAKLDENARELADNQTIASSVKTDDLSVAQRIKALGFDGDTARLFDLLPLVHVAWADGTIQKGERATILKVLEKRGVKQGSEGFRMMESMLEERPSDAFMSQSLAVLRDLTGGLNDRSQGIVDLCIHVAASAGGFLGLGKRIDEEERGLIAEIVSQLGDEASDHFKEDLGR